MAKKNLESVVGKKRFFSIQKMFVIFLFIIGIIIGAYIEHTMIEPSFNESLNQQLDKCELKKSIQDEQLDAYLKCLQKEDINPYECVK